MPPKKVPTAAPTRKSKAAPKSAPKVGSKKKVPPPPKKSKRKRASSPSPSPQPTPVWDQKITTQSQRNKKRFKLSMSTMYEDIDEEHIANLAKNLVGESRDTWGVPQFGPMEGITGRKARFPRIPRGGAFRSTEAKWKAMMEEMERMKPVVKPRIPNSPERSPILRIALEVREAIYNFLLTYPKPIMVKHDWTTVERNPYVDHNIILVCKQFAIEASAFLYRTNTFQALLRNTNHQFRRFEVLPTISSIHHANLRNLVIDCSRDCWNIDWYEKTAEGIMTLVSAKAVIKSLTLAVTPKRVGMSTTALGNEACPVTFADFLWYDGPLMMAIRMLAPKSLKVVIKKDGLKRFGMEVDMSYLQAGLLEEGPLANAETISLRKVKVQSVEDELRLLKERLEKTFEDDKWAVQEGMCTALDDEESVRSTSQVPATDPPVSTGAEEDPIAISSSEEESDLEKY